MHWLRSFPAEIPPGRAYVVDGLERLEIWNYDYSPLAAYDDDLAVLEWDIAVSDDDREVFQQYVDDAPGVPLVAPYRLYHVAEEPVWAHRRIADDSGVLWRWLRDEEPTADYFGFGMVYLPRYLIREFHNAPAPARGRPPIAAGGYWDARFTDQTFSVWYRHNRLPGMAHMARVCWEVMPVHLHGRDR